MNKDTAESMWEADDRAVSMLFTPPTDNNKGPKTSTFDEMKDISRVVREIASTKDSSSPVKKNCYQPWMMPYVHEYRQEKQQQYDDDEADRTAVSPCIDEEYCEEDPLPDEHDVIEEDGEDPSIGTRFAYS
jgi:hypothetical protein